jgi:hypothetical protein
MHDTLLPILGNTKKQVNHHKKKSEKKQKRSIKKIISWVWWLSPVIPAPQKTEMEGLNFEASPGKYFKRPHLQNNQNKMDKWQSASFKSMKP